MSKNKFVKTLLALGIGVVSATAVVGVAACGGGGGNGGGGGGGNEPTQLAAPVITLNQSAKKISWTAIDHATGYKVYEKLSTATSPTEKTTVTGVEYTINQTVAGTYEYYVIATSTSDDYTDSVASNKVNYTVQASQGGGEDDPTPPPAGKITVTFDTQGGSAVESQSVDGGSTATKPAEDPTRGGYVFDGWCSDAAGTTAFNFADPIVAPTTIYAKWRAVTKYDELLAKTTAQDATVSALVNEQFGTAKTLTTFDDWGTAGIYTDTNATDPTGNYVSVDGTTGVAELKDAGAGETRMIIDFGHVGASSVVEGYFEFVTVSQGNGWTPVQFNGTDGVKGSTAEIFGLRVDNGTLKYRVDGASQYVAPTGALTVADGTTYKVYYKFDLSAGSFEITINDVAYYSVESGITGVSGIKLVSSNSGAKTMKVDNVITVGVAQTVAEYATAMGAKLEAKYATVTDGVLGDLTTGLSDVVTAQKTTISAITTSFADVDTAYSTAVDACEAKVLENAKTSACSKIDDLRTGESITTNAEALTTAKTNGKSAVNAALTVDAVKEAYAAAEEVINAIEDDTTAAKADVTVTFKENDEGASLGTYIAYSEQVVAYADLLAAITVPAGKSIEGIYTDAAYTEANKIGENWTADTVTEDTAKTLYVKFAEIKSYTITVNASGDKFTATDNYSVNGWDYVSAKSITFTHDGTSYSGGAKLNSSGSMTIKLTKAAKVRIYFYNANENASAANISLKCNSGTAVEGTAVTGEVNATTGVGVYYAEFDLAANDTTTVSYVFTRGGNKEVVPFLIEINEA